VTKSSSRPNLRWNQKLLRRKKKSLKLNSLRTGDIVATVDANITDIITDTTKNVIENATKSILMMVRLTSKTYLRRNSSVTNLILLSKMKVPKSLRKNSTKTGDIDATEDADITDIITDITEDVTENVTESGSKMVLIFLN